MQPGSRVLLPPQPPLCRSAHRRRLVLPARRRTRLRAGLLGDPCRHDIYGDRSASNKLRRRTPMHDKTNANVTDEIASKQIVQNMQDAQSTNDDELFASASV